jgi:polyhydroxyalkanoate synthesis repressor PhaR
MQIIKKYANRKLYHTNRKQYITLEGIGLLIQAGDRVQVVDNETGEDITASILSQVALQSRGKRNSLSPQLLTDLIQTGGDTLAGLGRSMLAALSGSLHFDDELRLRVQRLRDDGTIQADEASRILQLLLHAEITENNGTLPAPGDLARLNAQVDALTAIVEQLLLERRENNQTRNS